MNDDKVLRKELLSLLDGGNAHMSFADAVADFPMERINAKPANCPYSFWHLVEHIRIAQWDILEFVVNPKHASPRWPEGYRPRPEEKTDEAGWTRSVGAVIADLEKVKHIVSDPSTEFFMPIAHAAGYTVFREILLMADHNSHHVGELAIMRQIEDLWPEDRRYLTGGAD
jgi:DinB superfamily